MNSPALSPEYQVDRLIAELRAKFVHLESVDDL